MKKTLLTISILGLSTFLTISTGFSQIISRADVARGVMVDLKRIVDLQGSGFQVGSVYQRYDLNLAEGDVLWQVEAEPGSLHVGRQNVPVNVLVDGVPASKVTVSAVIRRFVTVPVVRRLLKRGDQVTDEDIRWKSIEMTRPIDGLVQDKADVIGMVAQRSIRGDTPLRMKWFNEPLAIDQGDRVLVKLIRGGLVIRTFAIAVEKGRVGDTIQLRNPKSQIRYEAKVSGPGQARVLTW